MAAKQRFALFLESAGPGDAAAQAVRRHGAVAVAAARAEFSGRILIGVSTRAEIVALIGEPDTSAGSAIAYALATRPDYRYVFDFDDATGKLTRAGYHRVGASPPPPAPPDGRRDHGRFLAELAALGATEREVRLWLGDPDEEFGWWPISNWVYAAGLVIEFRHGVVEGRPRESSKSAR
jgi:hypothetical protein